MVSGAPEVPHPQVPPVHVRPSLAALLIFVLGAALIVPVTSHFWPDSLFPANTGRADYLHNLRFLKAMMVLEGTGLWMLAFLVWQRPHWMQALGGDDVLESHARLALLALLAVHALGVFFYLPPQQIASSDPIYTSDHAAQLYRAFGARQLSFAGSGMDGYDPFVNAGTRWTLVPDSRGFEWFARALRFVDLATVGKLWVLLVEFLVPIVVWCSARLCGCRQRAAWFAVLLALIYWHGGRPFLGDARANGHHSYLLAALLAVFIVAVAVHYLRSAPLGRLRALVGLWLLLAVIGFIHPLGLLIPAVPLLLLSVWGASSLRLHERLGLLVLPVTLALLHGTWILPLVQQRTALPLPAADQQLRGLQDLPPLLSQVGVLPLWCIGALALLGGWKVRHHLGHLTIGMLGLAVAGLVLFAWGYAIPGVRRFETVPFLVPAVLAACILGGEGLVLCSRWLRPRLGASLLMLLLVVGASWPAFAALLDTRFYYVHRVHATLDPRFHRLMERLQETPAPGARVLFQSTHRGWLTANGGDAALDALVPIFTGRQVLGLTHPTLTRGEANLAFLDGQLAGRHFSNWTDQEFTDFLRQHDVATIVAWSAGARRFLSRFPALLQPTEPLEHIQVFRVVEWQSILAGKADVWARFNHLEVNNIRAATIVLPYHWVAGMRSTPPVPISPVMLNGSAVPFIRIQTQENDSIVLQH